MSECILKTTKPIEHFDLFRLVEKAYGLGRNDFTIEYDSEGIPSVIIDTYIDKGAGLSLDVSRDGMKAQLSLFPPINFGGHLDNEKLEDFLLDERGLDTELINWDKLKECFQQYMDGTIVFQETIAEGTPKEDGIDARTTLHFDMGEKKPKVLDDGSVDFKDINNIVMVEENVPLLTYFPETEGVDGKTVKGDVLPARKGKKITIHKGNGVEYDEETNIYMSTLAGHVTFNANRLNVNPVYAVNGDVDYSEGNVSFHGTVTVSGDVISGFEVRAKNIVVWGVVRDATLIAEEDITVRTGIVSTGKGIIQAGNTVTATFIEGATIHAGVSVVIKDYCYNSHVFCEGEITALSGDGVINGGELHAFSSIEAKRIGVDNCSSFLLHVGVKYFLNDRIEKMIKQKENIERTLKETDRKIKSMAMSNPDLKSKEQLKNIIAHRKTLFEKYDGIDGEIENLIKKSMHPMPYVLAKDEINEGIRVVIYNTEYILPYKEEGSKFIFNQGTGHVVRVDPKVSLEYDPKKG